MVISKLSRRERKKRDTRERMIAAGLTLFAEKGIEGATIDDIAHAADVGKGTIYNYFRTKEDIVVAFLIDVERTVQSQVPELGRSRGSLDSIFTKFIQSQFDLKAPHHEFVRVFLAQMCARATTQTDWVLEIQAVMDPPLIELFSALQKRGLMRTDVDMATFLAAFKVMQLGLTVVWVMEGPPWRQTPVVIREQVRLFCSGIEVKR